MALAASVYPPLDQRPHKNTILLFDVDDTLTKPRQVGLFPCTSIFASKLAHFSAL